MIKNELMDKIGVLKKFADMKFLKTNWKLVFGVVLGIVIIPLFVYLWKFGSFDLSHDFTNWVDFSTFLSPFLVAALTIILAYISWQTLELMKLKEKPLLVVERVSGKIRYRGWNKHWLWIVKNIGSGPALNVKLFICPEKPVSGIDPFLKEKGLYNESHLPEREMDFEYFVRNISIPSNSELKIDWHPDMEKLSVVYSDLHGKKYQTTYSKSGEIDSDLLVFNIDNEGAYKGKVFFSRGYTIDENLGPKRIFTIGECFLEKEIIIYK